MAHFDHHTSRELDPQLHTHSFIFNLAPRRDGTWGAIVSRDLHKAQKAAGAVYRNALAKELERCGHHLEQHAHGFRVAAIPPAVERAFSKRRRAIEAAAGAYGYRTPKGMEQAALRTRRAKGDARLDDLFKAWRAEAWEMGFDLHRAQRHADRTNRMPMETARRPNPPALKSQQMRDNQSALRPAPSALTTMRRTATQIGHQLGRALQALKQPSGMPGLRPKLRQRDRDRERE